MAMALVVLVVIAASLLALAGLIRLVALSVRLLGWVFRRAAAHIGPSSDTPDPTDQGQ